MRLYATIVFVGAFSTWKIAIAEKWYLESSFVSQDLTHNPLRELPQTHTRIRSKAMERGPDHIVDELNTWLQRSTEGNVAHELTWAMTQVGPSNQDTHCATAKFRGVTLGEGQGTSRELAKREASRNALTYLKLNGLPRRQD